MAYEDPPEWRGRGVAGREGWPTYGGGGRPGAPRRHRADRWDDPTTDTGIDPERFRHNQPAYEPPPVMPPPVVQVFERDPEGLLRTAAWVAICRDILMVMALLGVLWFIGMTISRGGIPLWLPSK